ncbi:MAG: YdbL family protein [Rhodospirillaceae bacterium]|nr:YdbL family protein [Rhodospirillaceae bacterium]
MNVLKTLTIAAMLALGAAPAAAIDLDQARAQGLIGERPDGLVGVVATGAPADVVALADSVNKARLESYREVAQKNQTPIEAVQAIAGEKQVQRAKENKWYYMEPSGAWRK